MIGDPRGIRGGSTGDPRGIQCQNGGSVIKVTHFVQVLWGVLRTQFSVLETKAPSRAIVAPDFFSMSNAGPNLVSVAHK